MNCVEDCGFGTGRRVFPRRIKRVFAIALISIFLAMASAGADDSLLPFNEPWTGDLETMVEKNEIRALVPYSKTHYFLDGPDQRGVTYEALKGFEDWINKRLGRNKIRIRVIVIPTHRDKLFSGLAEGKGDIAAGNLTITADRERIVDFSDPFTTGVKEIVVSGPSVEGPRTVDDLAGREVFVRKSSSYYQSLVELNERFKKEKKKPVELNLVDDLLEDEDLLEMMAAGLVPMIVMDDTKADLWGEIFDNITFHRDVVLRQDGRIAWAFRKNSPELKDTVNRFVKEHKKGSLLFNIITKRYLKSTKWVKNNIADEEMEKFRQASELFRKYSGKYSFDWLMIGALAYQESGIDQSKVSAVGAVGVMQMLPSTAKDPNVGIPDIRKMENNIHAGIKYLRFLRDRYFENEPMDERNKTLFTFASYNAGPARIAGLREDAERSGLDPNLWFGNVELLAARKIGRETVQYVANIFKYYTAYRLIMEKNKEKKDARQELENSL